MIGDASVYQDDPRGFDLWLLAAVVLLICIGTVMVTSSSIATAEKYKAFALYFFWRHVEYLILGGVAAAIVYRVPLHVWEQLGPGLLSATVLLLVLVLVVGLPMNGSTRWICIGDLCFQISELAKISLIVYMAGFAVRQQERLRESAAALVAPTLVLGLLGILLILEPDFGALVVMVLTTVVMLYLSSVNVKTLLMLMTGASLILVMFIWVTGYNLDRVTSFVQPCAPAHALNSGYQLCQSLIAFGHGGVFGVGLGASVQKLFYLPEAHTDFIFAVLAEELGFVGVLVLIALYGLFVLRACAIARQAEKLYMPFAAYLAYGIAFWVAIQALISMGVNTGLMPTKGLTLPFVSYGGSSMLIMMIAVALLFRINIDTQPVRTGRAWRSPS